MQKVLVTGGAGFIGSHTVDRLLEKGFDVVVLDNLTKPIHHKGKIPNYLPVDHLHFIQGDVTEREAVKRALRDVSIIFHFAAYQDYLPDFSKFFHVNTVGTALIYELVVEYSLPVKKIVVASSQAVMGEGKYSCEEHGILIPNIRNEIDLLSGNWKIRCPTCNEECDYQISGEDVINPQNQYAMSKYTQEQIGINLGQRYNIPTVVLRYSIVQGSRQSFYNAYSGVMRIFSLALHHGYAPTIYEDGEQVRDFVNIDDVVDANILALESDEVNFQVFNVGGGRAYSVNEFYDLVESIYNTGISPVRNDSYRYGDTRNIISDITSLKKLGWEPRRKIEESIRAYKDYIEDQSTSVEILENASKTMNDLSVVRKVGI